MKLQVWTLEFYDEMVETEQGVDVNCFFFRKSNQEDSDDWGDSFLHCISIKEKECGKVHINCESLDLVATI